MRGRSHRAPVLWLVSLFVATCALSSLVGCKESEDSSAQTAPTDTASESPNQTDSGSAPLALGTLPAQASPVDDPSTDGWDSEVLAQSAKDQLGALGKLFFAEGDVADFITASFTGDPLVPEKLTRSFEDDLALVERGGPSDTNAPKQGVAELQAEFASVRKQSTSDAAERGHAEFKITAVARDPSATSSEDFRTTVLFSLSFPTLEAIVEHHASWIVDWSGTEPGNPRIESLEVVDFSRTTTKRPRPLFSDVTASALGADPCYASQLRHGMNHWLQRLPVRAMLNRFGTPGLSLGDVNGDGLDDLYLCQEPGLPNRLFLQNADGTARDVSAAWGVDWLEDSRSSLLVDLDNDGDQDLAVAIHGNVVIARNEGEKRFEVVGALPTSSSTASLVAADYDGDGLLDLYVCAYVEEDGGASIGAAADRFVYHDAENGAANSLFRNETSAGGGLSFKDVTKVSGLSVNNSRWSFSAGWEDFDDDGDQDLYVANDYGRNNLYRNDGGRFVDIAGTAGVEDSASGMSVAWGDYDRDGRVDLYVSNMFSAAGNRITSQENFKTGTAPSIRSRFKRFAQGNSLFRNAGTSFVETSRPAQVTLGRWAWSSNFVDLNNDAWLDLVVANGYLSSDGETGDL